MAFKGSLKDLISNSDETSRLWREVLHSVSNHGGTIEHINELLADAKEKNLLVNELAKLIVGKIWKIAPEPVTLALTQKHFQCTPAEFLSLYPDVWIHPGMNLEKGEYAENEPRETCQYVLYHFNRPVLLEEVLRQFASSKGRRELAGWRELVAYSSRLKPEDFSRCRILSAASPLLQRPDAVMKDEGVILPAAVGFSNKVELSWTGVKVPARDTFSPTMFFLVRIYD